MQWGYNNGQKKAVPFPISFSNTSYIITARIVWDSNQAHSAGHQFFHKFSDKILRQGNSGLPFEYIAIGI